MHLLEKEERERLEKGDASSNEGSDDDGELELASDSDLGSDLGLQDADNGNEQGDELQAVQHGSDSEPELDASSEDGSSDEEGQEPGEEGADAEALSAEDGSLAAGSSDGSQAATSAGSDAKSGASAELGSDADSQGGASSPAEAEGGQQDDRGQSEDAPQLVPLREAAGKRGREPHGLPSETRPAKQRRYLLVPACLLMHAWILACPSLLHQCSVRAAAPAIESTQCSQRVPVCNAAPGSHCRVAMLGG